MRGRNLEITVKTAYHARRRGHTSGLFSIEAGNHFDLVCLSVRLFVSLSVPVCRRSSNTPPYDENLERLLSLFIFGLVFWNIVCCFYLHRVQLLMIEAKFTLVS